MFFYCYRLKDNTFLFLVLRPTTPSLQVKSELGLGEVSEAPSPHGLCKCWAFAGGSDNVDVASQVLHLPHLNPDLG